MKYNLIRKMDISNGPGVRVSVFMQGCEFHCKNCFNSNTWSFDDGEDFTEETIDKILDLCGQDYVKGLSILGGDLKDKEVSKYIDVLVDGQYVDELHNPTLKWRGSSNQRVIDVQKSLATGDIITFDK